MAVDTERLRTRVERLDGLPTLPAVATRLVELTRSPRTSATEVGALIAEETSAAVFDLEGEIEEVVELAEGVDAPVEGGQRIGTVTYRQGEREVASAELVASRDIAAPGMLARIGIAATRMWRAIFGEPEPAGGVPSPS